MLATVNNGTAEPRHAQYYMFAYKVVSLVVFMIFKFLVMENRTSRILFSLYTIQKLREWSRFITMWFSFVWTPQKDLGVKKFLSDKELLEFLHTC